MIGFTGHVGALGLALAGGAGRDLSFSRGKESVA